ncbi:MAG: hypothetical protein ACKVQJ_14820 [Pyrinomonadaceae bacterium]
MIKQILAITLTGCSLLTVIYGSVDFNLEDGWKGIKVFESKRTDVIQALGNPVDEKGGEARFETSDAFVRVLFANEPCSNIDSITGGYNVEKGTTLQYEVRPKKELLLDQLNWKKDRYERFRDSHVRNFIHYYDSQDGVRLVAELMEYGESENVRTIYFERTLEQVTKFECKSKRVN